jgi:hypothetical protein
MSKDYNPNLIGFFNLDRLPQHDKGTMTQRVISGEKGMAVWSRIKAGTHTPSHSHHNEQIMLITAGHGFPSPRRNSHVLARRHDSHSWGRRARGLVSRRM